jgi:Arc/MetJ-type ribon-helix-helix transcriptional regulator
MKLLYLCLLVVAGATSPTYPSQSHAKKRGSSTRQSLAESNPAKKARTSPDESEAKTASAATHTPVPMDIDGKPDKREKVIAADNATAASAGTPATSQPNEATQKFQQFIDQHIQNSSFKTSNKEFLSTIEDFVRQGADIALAWGPNGETLMHTAAAWRNYRVTIYLHKHHPHLVDVTDNSDRVPLEHCLISPQSVTAKFELLEAHLFSDFAFLHTQERLKSIGRFSKKIWTEFINYRNQQLATPKLNSSDCFASTTPAASHTDEITKKLQQFIDQQIQNGSFVTSPEDVLEKIKDFERQEANLRLCWGPLEESLLHRAAYWRNHAVINYLASNYPDLVDKLDTLYRVPLEHYLTSPIKPSASNDSEAQLFSKFAFLHTQERLVIITPLNNARKEIWERITHHYSQHLLAQAIIPALPKSDIDEITQKFQQFIDQQIQDGFFRTSPEKVLEQIKDFEHRGADLTLSWGPYGETLMHKAAYWANRPVAHYLRLKYPHLINTKDLLERLPLKCALISCILRGRYFPDMNSDFLSTLFSAYALHDIQKDFSKHPAHRIFWEQISNYHNQQASHASTSKKSKTPTTIAAQTNHPTLDPLIQPMDIDNNAEKPETSAHTDSRSINTADIPGTMEKVTAAHSSVSISAETLAVSHTDEITRKLHQFIDQQIRDGSFVSLPEDVLEQVKDFEHHGADLNKPWGHFEETLMHKALYWHNYALIDYLDLKYPRLTHARNIIGLIPLEYAAISPYSHQKNADTQEQPTCAAATKPDWDSSESDWKSLLNPDLVDNRSQKRTPTKAVPARTSESETKSSASASASAAAAGAPQSPRFSDYFDRPKSSAPTVADDELAKLLLDNSPLHATLATPSPLAMTERAQAQERQRLALSASAAPTANQDLLRDL